MSRIRSKDTNPEIQVRKALTRLRIHYRLHDKKLAGNPDIVIGRKRLVVFVNGCFWHQHDGCKRKTSPKTNAEYWEKKLERNVEKQKSHIIHLTQNGWNPVVIWECEANDPVILGKRIEELLQ